MAEFGNYLVQSSVCVALFYMVYYLFLRKLTFFKLNRVYLLVSLALSLLIPLCNIAVEINHDAAISQFIPYWYIQQSGGSVSLFNIPVRKSSFDWYSFFTVVYISGMLLVFTRLIISLLIIAKAHKGDIIERSGRIKIIRGTNKIGNCSFFNTIFIFPGTNENEEYQQIIAHEKCHIKLYHTWDKLFIHFIQVIFWFNPFVYLYRRSIDGVHEFEVDALLTEKTDKKVYAGILLELALQRNSNLVNNFSSQPLKTRIRMLFRNRSGKMKTALYAAGIPVVLLTILSFNMESRSTLANKFMTAVNSADGAGNNSETALLKNQTSVTSSGTFKNNTSESNTGVKLQEQTINQPAELSQPVLKQENSGTQAPDVPFLVRTTIKDEDGNEYDEVRLRFGGHHLVGGVTKGAKILYLIGGKEYKEEEIKNFTQANVAGFSCPCSVQVRKDNEPLIAGIYEGQFKISNAN